jgi:hypothetical protein
MTYTLAQAKDIGAFLYPLAGLAPTRLTTASSITYGTAIDRSAYTNVLLSGQVVVQASATLKAAKQATFVWKVQHGDTTTAYTDLYDHTGAVVSSTLTLGTTSSTATQTVSGVSAGNYRFSGAKRYVRVAVTPTIAVGSSTVTAVGNVSSLITFGSGDGKTPVA